MKSTLRFYRIIQVILQYGLDQALPKTGFTRPIRCGRNLLFWLRNRHHDKAFGLRLRLALQELGPVWIKLGQMLSTRRDLFPDAIADELALLQDQVEPFSGKLARQQIETALGCKLENWFSDFDETALASASIAQVHTARFKADSEFAGREVVLKVIRPNIETAIEADIGLMYRLARWIPRLSSEGRRLRPVEVVREYEKTILDELDLRREMANAIQLRRNFENSPMLYIPEMYSDFCYKNVIVMERIYGIQVSDIAALEANGTNMKLLAERGVQVFFTQVFRDSFFHADMHPGNIFVNPNHPDDPQYIGIDCGIVGSLNREDKRYLAENFLAFFNRDYQRVAQLHVDSGWVPEDTNVQEFEQAIRTVCDPIFAKPLSEISFGHVLLNLFNTARRFNMEVQPQLVLLQKTLLYIEGLGRQIYPQLDLWQTAKPFLQDWLNDQVGLKSVYRSLKEKLPYFREHFAELPETFYHALQQQQQISRQIGELNRTLLGQERQRRRSWYSGLIGSVIFITTLLQFAHLPRYFSSCLLLSAVIIWLYGLLKSD
ncbi:ubiquinone biosynthesis regulatory protein kinase UbiB [Pasteurellaceae bacterium USgator11]|nr:ubiquinone biosynthesis regulatory protein kinase UbiB [Pasteurellaceae bacterium USgator41]TNG93188.1 ubiquinone biosynthesis regulatory protein kinase UbiB [Pasteurellaceae bacterium UScroc12]TNG97229.1 ubiquinone biosynthesis regulatory protein kinase UbiB [Pasteurellaceae bacterium UScroc31]TNG99781.1 ubiquinone biosynthesis regulatory protein kinase UbiB [Pasteurellaceae bacterium USgator11]